jgi:ABC-2 type transport system ATP-binding protein
MSSHILAEVARLANRIGIIHGGKLLREMDLAGLEHARRRRLLLRSRDLQAALQVLSAAGYAAESLADGRLALNQAAALERPDEISSLLVQGGTPPTELLVEQEELEDYFLRLVGANGDK